MFRETGQSDPSSCLPVELLLRHVIQPETLTEQQCEDVVRHLACCPNCSAIYDALCEAESGYCDQLAEAAGLPRREPAFSRSDEQAVAELWRRVDEEETRQDQQHRRMSIPRFGRFVAAIAACLLLAAGAVAWWRCGSPAAKSNKIAVAQHSPSPSPADGLSVLRWANAVDDVSPILADNTPFDPAKVDQVTWCEEHREWFAGTFPQAFQLQDRLQAEGIHADYVELLVVSGVIWQCHFDPTHPFERSFAVEGPAAAGRVAEHYRVPADVLGTEASRVSASEPTTGLDLQQWKSVMVAAANQSSGMDSDLLLYSLRAGSYLANTRAAASLWVWNHPREAETLLAKGMPGALSMTRDPLAWSRDLARQAEAARRAARGSLELLILPSAEGCAVRSSAAYQRLMQSLDELMVPPKE